MSLSELLDALAPEPRGRPLYASRLSTRDLAALESGLRASHKHVGDRVFAAAFCLFAAHHVCRNYVGGAWKWQPVLDALGWAPTNPELYETVESGLKWLRRPLLRLGQERRFLVTLFCEGGLPLGILSTKEKGARLREYLRRLLQLSELHRVPASALAAGLAPLLPLSLRQPVVLELAADLVDAVKELRAQVAAGGAQESGIAWLDQDDPDWRARVPLLLHDAVADTLLRGLMAVPEVAPVMGGVGIELITVLSTEGESVRIERRPVVAATADAPSLAAMFGLSVDALPPRIYLSLLTADGVRRPLAVASFDTGNTLHLDTLSTEPIARDDRIARPVLLVASFAQAELGRAVVPGGEALPDTAWVFEGPEHAPVQKLRATGSFVTAAPRVTVMLPLEASTDGVEGDVDTASERVLLDRRIVNFQGKARIRQAGQPPIDISTHATHEQPYRYELVGRLFSSGLPAEQAWLGEPRVERVDVRSGVRSEVPAAQTLIGTANGVMGWKYGRRKLSVRVGDSLAFATSIDVLPGDFRVEVQSGSGGHGVVTVRSRELSHLALLASPDVEGSVEEVPHGGTVHVRSSAASPEPIELDLLFGGAGQARIALPFPLDGARFLDAAGRVLAPGTQIAVSRLGGTMGQVLGPMASRSFEIEARLVQRGERGQQPLTQTAVFLGPPKRVTPDRNEAQLGEFGDTLSAMLAQSPLLDACIELRLVQLGGSRVDQAFLKITRFEGQLDRSPGAQPDPVELWPSDSTRQSVAANELTALVLEARPLPSPGAAPDLLAAALPPFQCPRAAEPAWHFVGEGKAPGPYLVLAKLRGHLKLRPLLITVLPHGGRSEPSSRSPLQQLIAANLRPAQRRAQMSELIEHVASDALHPDIPLLQAFLDTLGDLPATTFDAVVALAGSPDAVALMLLLAKEPLARKMLRHLEELPFSWSAFPVAAFERGARVIIGAAERVLPHGPPSLRHEIVMGFMPCVFRVIPLVMPSLRLHLSAAVDALAAPIDEALDPRAQARSPAALAALQRRLPDEIAGLRRRHADDVWPELPEIKALAHRSGLDVHDAVRVFSLGCPDHQRAVTLAPIVSSRCAVRGCSPAPAELFALRRARAFDPAWFEFGLRVALPVHFLTT